jgi:hypothetical protein
MKKLVITFSILILFGFSANAQVFEKGAQAINIGLGVGTTYLSGNDYKMGFPSISGSYEYGLLDVPMGAHLEGVVSVGGFVGWSNVIYRFPNWPGDLEQVYNTFLISARGNYHFIFDDKFDTYAGIHLGYISVSGKWKGDGTIPPDWSAATGGFTGGAYIGGRYYFNDYIAVYAELGWMLSIFQAGITIRLYK